LLVSVLLILRQQERQRQQQERRHQQQERLQQQMRHQQQVQQQQVLQQQQALQQQEFQQLFRHKRSKQEPTEQQRERIISWLISLVQLIKSLLDLANSTCQNQSRGIVAGNLKKTRRYTIIYSKKTGLKLVGARPDGARRGGYKGIRP